MPVPWTKIDAHTHTSASDGTDTPTELMQAAAHAGLDCIALTDHDSWAGWGEASAAVQLTGVALVRGMELSTQAGPGSIHMLAYLFDPNDTALIELTAEIRDSREHRAERIVARMAEDFPITWEDVLEQAQDARSIGRPHIADALVALGLVPNRSAAFDQMLSPKAGYYQPYYAPSPVDAVVAIRAAGGVPVVAHPGAYAHGAGLAPERLRALVDAGLGGIEAGHRLNSPQLQQQLRADAARYNLIVTGSSDYHGTGKPNPLGEFTTAPDQLERIIDEATGVPVIVPA